MHNLRASLAALGAVSGLDLHFPLAGGPGEASDPAGAEASPVRDLRSFGDFLDENDRSARAADDDSPPSPDGSDAPPPATAGGNLEGLLPSDGDGDGDGTGAAPSLDEEAQFIASLAARYGLADLSSSGGRAAGAGGGAATLRSPERARAGDTSVVN